MRNSILTLACFGLLSTAAMGMPPESMNEPELHHGTNTDPTNQPGPEHSESSMGSAQGNIMGSEITGEILTVEGDLYTVKDSTGKEVQLHVDESTEKSGKLIEGDKIKAEVTPQGHAVMLKKANDMN
ncbi:MAG TPA: hypothetical protein DD706_17670 [Nitrospiraceae bacterium]|nr:hypothetical protein [Nitrospiraceae bacterium]